MVEFLQSAKHDGWYYRVKGINGEILFRSSEMYRDETDTRRGFADACKAVLRIVAETLEE